MQCNYSIITQAHLQHLHTNQLSNSYTSRTAKALLSTQTQSYSAQLKPTNMGQRTSKINYQEPSYYAGPPSHGNHGNSQHDHYAAQQQYRKDQKREQKKKRSRRNGVVAAVAGAA